MVLDTLREPPSEWNRPARPRYGVPLSAALGAVLASIGARGTGVDPAIAAGLGAGVTVLVAWVILAALD